jgi:serine/threonine protein kinase
MNTNINNQFKTPLSFNDFKILKEIGSGYFASVYKVKYKKDGQIYAIKRYDKSKDKSGSALDYYREKAILYDLNKRRYPSIVKLHADFEDNVSRNLVMECVEGITLQHKRGNMNGYVPQNEVINILTQLLETLQFLHEKCNIVHRDIKPSNIIIQKDNKIKLLDFGISVYLKNLDLNLLKNTI